MLFDNYYDGLTYIAQRHARDIHVAEEIVQYTLAELWLRHQEKRIDGCKSVQHYLVNTVKRRARKAFARRIEWYKKHGLESELLPDNIDDEEDVRLIIENPPLPYDKFGFDQSTYYHWRRVEYIFYPWLRYRCMFFEGLKNLFIALVVIVFAGCAYYLVKD